MSRLAPVRAMLVRMRLAGGIAFGQVIGRGALALVLLLLVRHLRAEEFADLALALAIVAILATVADAGFARLLVRDTARAGAAAHHIVRELLRLRMRAVAVAALGAALILALGPTPFGTGFSTLAIAYLVTESIAFGYENAAVGAERPLRFVLVQCVAAMAMVAGIVLLVISDGVTLTAAMAVLAVASGLKVCGHLLAWRGGTEAGKGGEPRPPMTLFRQALPFLGLTLLAVVYYRVGIIALYALRGATEAASYAVASRIVDAIALLAGVAFLSASPALSRMHRDEPDRIWAAWRRMVCRTALAAVPCVVLAGLFAETICGALFGEPYRTSAAQDLRLMLPGAGLMIVQGLSAAVVFMSDDHRDVLALTAVNVIACVAMTFGLSATMGSQGAALALTLAEAVSVFTFGLLIYRRHGSSTGAVPVARWLRA